MNEFKESLKVTRESSGEIIITEPLKQLLIELMKGNISKKEVLEKTDIGDKGTVELKIKQLVGLNPELQPLYEEYLANKREDFFGYSFRAEAIEMLRKDYSQTVMAKMIGVSRRSFSTKVKQLQERHSKDALGKLLKEHAERKMKRREISNMELLKINIQLDEYEEQHPVAVARYEKRNSVEVRKENLEKVISLIEQLREEGTTVAEMDRTSIISEAQYRKYKLELEALSKILDNKGEKEQ